MSPALANRLKALMTCVLSLLILCFAKGASAEEPTVVVMLFDGFSPAYIERFPTPALDRLQREGAWSGAMDQAFPTISLIGGVTISTGCWPKNHGIVSNLFLDPERGRYDHASDADWLLGCEHLHQAAERQGLRTAALGWYGRFSGTRGLQASITPMNEKTFDDFPSDAARAAQIVEQLTRPVGERPRLILAYLKGPDRSGHFTGMTSEETRNDVIAADAAVGSVLAAIDSLNAKDTNRDTESSEHEQEERPDIQLIVTTDHGMVPVEHLVNLRRILRRLDIDAHAVSSGTSSFLYFKDPSPEAVHRAFEKLSTYSEFDVVRREDQPPGWHIGAGSRVGELIVSAHPPYFIEDPESWPWALRWLQYIGPDFVRASAVIKATHGYPTGTPGVEGLLYTWGSAFATGTEIERVRAIDIHPTVMHVLGLDPGQPVDGTIETRLLQSTLP